MGSPVNSETWKRRQARDPFVKLAQAQNYRARSVFKIKEIDQKYQLTKNTQILLDLGSSPGAWSQYLSQKVKIHNDKADKTIISVDLLEMQNVPFCHFIKGDFTSQETQNHILQLTNNLPIDLIISDISPNLSGIKIVDNAKSIGICETILDFAINYLKPSGHLVCKVFQGSGFEDLYAQFKKNFHKVQTMKPNSSRKESREIYLIGLNKKESFYIG